MKVVIWSYVLVQALVVALKFAFGFSIWLALIPTILAVSSLGLLVVLLAVLCAMFAFVNVKDFPEMFDGSGE